MDTTVYVVMSYDEPVAVFDDKHTAWLYAETRSAGWVVPIPYNLTFKGKYDDDDKGKD